MGSVCMEYEFFCVSSYMPKYLVQVNTNPGLSCDTSVDEIVKKPMLHQLFSLLGLPDTRPFQRRFSTVDEEGQAPNQYFKQIVAQLNKGNLHA